LADGISHSQYETVSNLLKEDAEKLVSSTELVYEWLSIKLPEEVEILRKAAQLTADWQVEAYQQVIPGKTTDARIAQFLKDKMKLYGVTDAWSPDQNPNVNSGADRGHSHATEKVIMPGDVIQIDFGIKVHNRWVTDIQRFAYVLKEGETEAPEDILYYWNSGKAGNRAALGAMKPGVKGIDVDRAQRVLMEKAGSAPVMWSTGHPVGYVAHDIGPNLGGAQSTIVREESLKELKTGMTFAFDGFHAWELKEGGIKTISVEEMAVVTESGAEYLIEPQEELILIPSVSN
jgi:Xaa-Pro aminopeptidase